MLQESRFSRLVVYKVQTYEQTHIHFYIGSAILRFLSTSAYFVNGNT